MIGLLLAVGVASRLLLALGPAPHHVTRFEAEKIAVTHLLQPGQQVHIQTKLVRQWQLALISPNDGGNVWSNDLLWLVLMPGDHFAHSGHCCTGPPRATWTMAQVNDRAGYAQLDGIITGVSGESPEWWRLLPDLSDGH